MTPSADEGPAPLDLSLRTLLDEERAQAAATGRRRGHLLRAEAATDLELRGLLRALAAARRRVVVATAPDRELVGLVAAVGADHLALVLGGGEGALVPFAAVASVRSSATPAAHHLADPHGGVGLAEALAELAEQQRPVTVRDRTGRAWRGQLVGAGADVAVLVTGERPPAYVHLPHGAITEVVTRWAD